MDKAFVYAQPVKIRFGEGSFDALPFQRLGDPDQVVPRPVVVRERVARGGDQRVVEQYELVVVLHRHHVHVAVVEAGVVRGGKKVGRRIDFFVRVEVEHVADVRSEVDKFALLRVILHARGVEEDDVAGVFEVVAAHEVVENLKVERSGDLVEVDVALNARVVGVED